MSKGKSKDVKFPFEVAVVGVVGLSVGGVAAFRGVSATDDKAPEIGELLPWWLVTALISVVAVAALLNVLVRFSQSKEERKAFALVSEILQPLFAVFAACLSVGVAGGWVLLVLTKGSEPGPALALCFGLLVVAVLGIVVLSVAMTGGRDALVRWHRRLNPSS